jgi:metacaspase-1
MQVTYIKNVHGFSDENITILLDDDQHQSPTRDNMLAAYKKVVSESQAGDAIFCHYSGTSDLTKEATISPPV